MVTAAPRSRRYLQLDVFAERPGAGNALGVVVDAHGLETADMQAIAAWLALPETVFFLPPGAGADYHIRIFTPGCELPFAGHPSVGAAWAALELGLAHDRAGALVQRCAKGLLPVRVQREGDTRRLQVRAPRAFQRRTGAEHVAALARMQQAWPAPAHPPALWDNGPGWWLVELADAAALRALQPDLAAIGALSRDSDATGLAFYALEPGDDHDMVVRAFCPLDAPGTPEDPVTGSANACIAARLHAEGRLPGHAGRYRASQGREVGRDGRVDVQIDEQGEAWIGGQVQLVLQARLTW